MYTRIQLGGLLVLAAGWIAGCDPNTGSISSGDAIAIGAKASEVAALVGGADGYGGTPMDGYLEHAPMQMGFDEPSDLALLSGVLMMRFVNDTDQDCSFDLSYIASHMGAGAQSMDVHDYRAPEDLVDRFKGSLYRGHHVETPAFGSLMIKTPSSMKAGIDRYDASIAYVDRELGQLLRELEALGVAEQTLIVATSDHGEPLGQRGEWVHNTNLYDEQVHVPLIIHAPWSPEHRRVAQVVSLMELAPTLVDLAGLPAAESFQGRSLLRASSPAQPPSAVGALLVANARTKVSRPASWFIRHGDWKLLMNSQRARLFHIPFDPHEEVDVSERYPVTARFMREALIARSPSFERGWSEPPPLQDDLDDRGRAEFEEDLRALGYLE